MNSASSHRTSGKREYPVLAITMGDRNGIGPEVILKYFSENDPAGFGSAVEPAGNSAAEPAAEPAAELATVDKHGMKSDTIVDSRAQTGFLLFASRNAMHYYAEQLGIRPFWEVPEATGYHGNSHTDGALFPDNIPDMPVPEPGNVLLVPSVEPDEPVRPGHISGTSGNLAMHAVSAAVSTCLSGQADALVTAPISKEAIYKAGYRVPGHTEYLARLTGTREVGMMLVNEVMRVGLATIHLPLREVPDRLSTDRLERYLRLFHHALLQDFRISDPRIAVLGLNPHAGDGGVLGNEEQTIISPAIRKMQEEGLRVEGPFSADGFFGNRGHENTDLVMAMYHDQGLIPLKLSGFGTGINVTVGLPVVRTSPDHGTAFSLAGKNRADAGSMKAAIALARSIAMGRLPV